MRHLRLAVLLLSILLGQSSAQSLRKVTTLRMDNPIACVFYSPDSRFLLVDTQEYKQITPYNNVLYEIAKGKKTTIPERGLLFPGSLLTGTRLFSDVPIFSKNSRYLYSISKDQKALLLHDLENQNNHRSITNNLDSFNMLLKLFMFSPDGTSCALTFSDGKLKHIDLKTLKIIGEIDHSGRRVDFMEFTPNGKYIVSTSNKKTVKIYSTQTRRVMRTFEIPEFIFAEITPDSRYMIIWSQDKDYLGTNNPHKENNSLIGIVDLENIAIKKILFQSYMPHCSVSPNGKFLCIEEMIVSRDGKKKSSNEKPVANILYKNTLHEIKTGITKVLYEGGENHHCRFSDGENYLLAKSTVYKDEQNDAFGKSVTIYDLNTKKAIFQVVHSKKITIADISPDEKYLLTVFEDGKIRVVNMATRKVVNKINMEQQLFRCSFSPDGKILNILQKNGTARIYHPSKSKPIKTFKVKIPDPQGYHYLPSDLVKFSPDSRYLAVRDELNSIDLFRVSYN